MVSDSLDYLKVRISKKVHITFTTHNNAEIFAKLNPSLFSWVLENLIKNAVDAMKGEGNIDIYIMDQSQISLELLQIYFQQ